MLVIRFSRTGKKGERKYRVVVKERRSRRDGDSVDMLGFYEKKAGGTGNNNINMERLTYWIKNGAQLSPAVKQVVYPAAK